MPNQEPLDLRLKNWLEKQGYPLEMRAAREFQQKRFQVYQSFYYLDPVTRKAREMDILALVRKHQEDIDVQAACITQCKSSPDKPWVLFTAPADDNADRYSYYSRIGSRLGIRLLSLIHNHATIPIPPVLQLPSRIGYGVIKGFKESRDSKETSDTAFAAVMSVASAAMARRQLFEDPNEPPSSVCDIMFPVIVIDSPLFSCYLAENGTVSLTEIEVGMLQLQHPVGERTAPTLLNIITFPALPMFAQSISDLIAFIGESHADSLDRISRQWKRDMEQYETR
jgi:hypothetical protein